MTEQPNADFTDRVPEAEFEAEFEAQFEADLEADLAESESLDESDAVDFEVLAAESIHDDRSHDDGSHDDEAQVLAEANLLDAPVGAGVSQGSLFAASTGDPRVDGAVSRLADLGTSDITEHPAILEDVHRRLHDALADLDK